MPCYQLGLANELPFGGVRGSGVGRLNGREGIRACCNAKSVLDDRLPMHRPVKLYPPRDGDYACTKGVIEMIYRRGIIPRAKGVLAKARATLMKSR